jgi:hypothetical protein
MRRVLEDAHRAVVDLATGDADDEGVFCRGCGGWNGRHEIRNGEPCWVETLKERIAALAGAAPPPDLARRVEALVKGWRILQAQPDGDLSADECIGDLERALAGAAQPHPWMGLWGDPAAPVDRAGPAQPQAEGAPDPLGLSPEAQAFGKGHACGRAEGVEAGRREGWRAGATAMMDAAAEAFEDAAWVRSLPLPEYRPLAAPRPETPPGGENVDR